MQTQARRTAAFIPSYAYRILPMCSGGNQKSSYLFVAQKLEGFDPNQEFAINGECCEDLANAIVRNLVAVCVCRLRKYDEVSNEVSRNGAREKTYVIFSQELSDQESKQLSLGKCCWWFYLCGAGLVSHNGLVVLVRTIRRFCAEAKAKTHLLVNVRDLKPEPRMVPHQCLALFVDFFI